MKPKRSFFAEQKEQSEIKSSIVTKYFRAWCTVMLANKKRYKNISRIAYMDFFCGPGRYDDGSKSTPLLVLEAALANPDLANLLMTVFNDRDEGSIKSLVKSIDELPGIEKLKFKPIVLNDEVGKNAEAVFSELRLCPVFSFFDPFGYKGLSAALIRSLIKDWGCDSVFFFNYSRINAGLNNEAVSAHIDALFGKDRANRMRKIIETKSPRDRENIILEELAAALKEIGAQYVLPFRFARANGKRLSHALVFVTKNIKGYEIMKGIMASESSTMDQGVASFSFSPADASTPLLFSLARPLEALAADLQEHFSGESLTVKEIYDRHHIDRPFVKKNYKTALLDLERTGVVSAYPKVESRPKRMGENTIGDNVLITFRKK